MFTLKLDLLSPPRVMTYCRKGLSQGVCRLQGRDPIGEAPRRCREEATVDVVCRLQAGRASLQRVKVQEIAGLVVRSCGADTARGLDVVLMHGFGASGSDLVSLADAVDAPEGTRFFFPEAPLQLPPELGAGDGRAWWMIDLERIQRAVMRGDPRDMTQHFPPGLAPARELLLGTLDALVADHGVRRERLVLGGFSQGAMLACDVALRTEDALAGLVLMSGTYLSEAEWQPRMAKRRGLPVLQSHGTTDPLLSFAIAERLRDALTESGLPTEFVPFHGGHGIAPNVIDRLGAFLGELA